MLILLLKKQDLGYSIFYYPYQIVINKFWSKSIEIKVRLKIVYLGKKIKWKGGSLFGDMDVFDIT